MDSSAREKTQLAQILPLDDESLQKLLDYTSSLSKDAAAEHLKTLLGDSARALEFIRSYNSRRNASPKPFTSDRGSMKPPTKAAKSQGRKMGKSALNDLPPPRQVENQGDTSGAYRKKGENDYIVGRSHDQKKTRQISNALALSDQPVAQQMPKTSQAQSLRAPPSASGPLISDLPNVRSKSTHSSRNVSPAPKATVSVTGGASMHGASTTLQDLVRHWILPGNSMQS